MFQIRNTIVSREIIETRFGCDLGQCKGNCCVHGDAGAPLEPHEASEIEIHFDAIRPYLQPEGIDAIKKQGFAIKDEEGELVTPLIEGRECAYCYFENGIARCGIEKAYLEKKITFRKPISCWLYPIRVSRLSAMHAVVLHRWKICQPAYEKGAKEGIPVFRYLKNPLIARFGQEWYDELEQVAQEWQNEVEKPQVVINK
ncbi:MAG: DUF3109 family protein [Bacteroidales bacterium]|nr:DUF3109 family protein [Bacteroidales bacterium]